MNFPKPAPISKLTPAAAASPAYCYVPQYSRMSFVVTGSKKTVLVRDEEESFLSLLGTGWKRTAIIILIGAVAVIVLPTIIRMIRKRR